MNGQTTSTEASPGDQCTVITATVQARLAALVAAIRARAKMKATAEQDEKDYSTALRSLREHLGGADMLEGLLRDRRMAAAEEDNQRTLS